MKIDIKKARIIACTFAIIGLIIFVSTLIYTYWNSRNYISVNAIITDFEISDNYNSVRQESSRTKYIDITYTVNDIQYTNKMQYLIKPFCEIGDTYVVKYNPVNPVQIQNSFLIHCMFFMTIFFSFILYSIITLIKRSRSKLE